MKKFLNFRILPQPDPTSCGPTCLHAVYQYYKEDIDIREVMSEVKMIQSGGTLAVLLACHALKKGYQAKIYTYNLQVFDPSWFDGRTDIPAKLAEQARFKKEKRFRIVWKAYREFLELGGTLAFEDLSTQLIRKYMEKNIPILTGLSATYLYREKREYGRESREDDIRGTPAGHFVVLCGYDRETKNVLIADPMQENPFSKDHFYTINIGHVLNAVLLGVVTHDANMLILTPPGARKP